MTGLVRTPHFSPKRVALMLTILLVFSACQRNSSDRPKATQSVSGDAFTIETIERRISIKMQGADSAEHNGTNELRIQAPNRDAPLNMMVISTDGYIDVGGGMKLSIGIVLMNVYKRDGPYTLPPNVAMSPEVSPDPNNPATLSGNSRVTFYAENSSTPEPTLRAYDTLTKPCSIVIKNKGKAGEVHCPEIRSVENTTVAFDMTWGA